MTTDIRVRRDEYEQDKETLFTGLLDMKTPISDGAWYFDARELAMIKDLCAELQELRKLKVTP